MPQTKKYLVETDKGKFEVEVEEPTPAVNMSAKGGDTINGQDPNDPGLFSRITGALKHAAQPETAGDFLSLIIPSGLGEAVSTAKDYGRILKQGVSESPTIKGIPGQILKTIQNRPKSLQDFQARGFNELPLAEQMPNLPETPVPTRAMGAPPPRIGVPEPTPRPLYQQVDETVSRPDPILSRGGGSPHPNQKGINDLPLASQMDMLPSKGGVGSARQAIPPAIEQGTINDLPLAQQMDHLPERPSPLGVGSGEPPPVQGYINDLPLFKQMEMMGTHDTPIMTRGPEPPQSAIPTVQGEVVPEPQWPTRGATDAEFTEVPKRGLPEAGGTQLGPSDMLNDLPADVPPMTLEERMLQAADQQGQQMAKDVPWNGDPVEEGLDRSANRRQEAFTDRVNGSTPDESVVNYTPGAEPDPNAILDSQPLGKPKIKAWKSGAGPSDELIQQIRAEEGSKAAATRLAIPQKQVLERAPRTGPAQLPPAAQNRIANAMAGMTPEEKLTYLASAPNGVSAEFIKSLLGQ